ncbi:hypothetical protein TB2_035008 [Malus domestica]
MGMRADREQLTPLDVLSAARAETHDKELEQGSGLEATDCHLKMNLELQGQEVFQSPQKRRSKVVKVVRLEKGKLLRGFRKSVLRKDA